MIPAACVLVSGLGLAQGHGSERVTSELSAAQAANQRSDVRSIAQGVASSDLPSAALSVESGATDSAQLVSLPQVERELARVNEAIAQTDAAIEQVRRAEELIDKRLAVRGKAYYRLHQAGWLPLADGFHGLVDHTSKLDQLRQGIHRDLEASKAVQHEKLTLAERRRALVDRQQPLMLKRRAMEQSHMALMEAQDRQRAFERAFSQGPGLGDYTAVYGASAAVSGSHMFVEEVKGFRAMLGRLSFPVAGRAEVRLVRRIGAGGLGLELLAPRGTAVLSVYDGRVAFADAYGSYGKVVILDHGEQYFSVYGELDQIQVEVGQSVGARAPVGTVGPGESGQGGLYFELRQDADTIDPSPWFGL